MSDNANTSRTNDVLTAIVVYLFVHAYAWVLIHGSVGTRWVTGSTVAYATALVIIAVRNQ